MCKWEHLSCKPLEERRHVPSREHAEQAFALLAVGGDEHDPEAPGLRARLLEEFGYVRREHFLRHERERLRTVLVERQKTRYLLEGHRLVQRRNPVLDEVREQGLRAEHADHAPVLQNRKVAVGLLAHDPHRGQHGICELS